MLGRSNDKEEKLGTSYDEKIAIRLIGHRSSRSRYFILAMGLLHPGNLKKGLSRPIAAASKENTKIDHKNSKNKIKAERKKRKGKRKGKGEDMPNWAPEQSEQPEQFLVTPHFTTNIR